MALTKDEDLAERLRRHRSHGIVSDPSFMIPRRKDEIWNYQQVTLGYNYRMTDVQAALGISQLNRIDNFVSKRRDIAKFYDQSLSETEYILPFQNENTKSSFHLYPIRVNFEKCKKNQKDIFDHLKKANIFANLHYIPIYRQPFFEKLGFKEGYCPESEAFHRETVSIPVYPDLKREDQKKVISALTDALV